MSKVLNTFIQKEYVPLKQFKLEVIKILYEDCETENLTDEEIFVTLKLLKNLGDENENMTSWALQNIS